MVLKLVKGAGMTMKSSNKKDKEEDDLSSLVKQYL